MTTLLMITILVLVSIAVWQITKIFQVAQLNKKVDDSQVANEKDNDWNGKLMFAFLVFIYLITIYSFWEWGDVLLPEAASEHGVDYDRLMWISMALIFFVQIVTQALLHYFSYKYRGRKGLKALFYADNDRLEFIWTIIPVIVLAGLILYGLYAWSNIMNFEEDEDALDDVVVQELHLPVGRKVIFKMRSQDVLHSAYMPHFRAQMNCVPGMITEFAFTPTITTEEMRQNPDMVAKVQKINKIRYDNSQELITNGEEALDPYQFDYLLLCNKICGASHYNMQMKIIVEEEKDFNSWMSQQTTFAEVIQ